MVPAAVAVDEATCLRIDASTGHTEVMGRGLVRWFTREVNGIMVRSQHATAPELTPPPPKLRFEGLAKVAAATRAAHDKEEREKEARQRAQERRRARKAKADTTDEAAPTDEATAPTEAIPAPSADTEPATPTPTEDVRP